MENQEFQLKHSRKSVISEMKREQGMRRKVWMFADKKNLRFVDAAHQHSYDRMQFNIELLESINDSEFYGIMKRKFRRENELKYKQSKMF